MTVGAVTLSPQSQSVRPSSSERDGSARGRLDRPGHTDTLLDTGQGSR